jgi:hypothetical protein
MHNIRHHDPMKNLTKHSSRVSKQLLAHPVLMNGVWHRSDSRLKSRVLSHRQCEISIHDTTAVALYVAIIRNRYMELTSWLVEKSHFQSEPRRQESQQTNPYAVACGLVTGLTVSILCYVLLVPRLSSITQITTAV